jgi:hypothetical protein
MVFIVCTCEFGNEPSIDISLNVKALKKNFQYEQCYLLCVKLFPKEQSSIKTVFPADRGFRIEKRESQIGLYRSGLRVLVIFCLLFFPSVQALACSLKM